MIWIGIAIGTLLGAALAAVVILPLIKRQTRRALSAERRARDARRLAEIGAMTGGLAHEIKNPLSTIGLNAQLLAEGIEDLEGVDDSEKQRLTRRIGTLTRETERLREILADFLRFAGEIRLDRQRVDLNDLLEEMIDFYLPQAEHHGIKLRADFTPGPTPALIDRKQIQQAILNLLINATQAMEREEGSSVAEAGPREIYLRTRSVEDDLEPVWQIHVIDTGPGIPEDAAEQIFTPYFTTKPSGSGLGLPTTRRLIEEHGGRIDVHTSPGQGTDFVITLPRDEEGDA